jgi:hypothetical protein
MLRYGKTLKIMTFYDDRPGRNATLSAMGDFLVATRPPSNTSFPIISAKGNRQCARR